MKGYLFGPFVVSLAAFEPSLFPAALPSPPAPAIAPLRKIESRILAAAPAYPVSLKRLAYLSGHGYNWWFRAAVRSLVERGLLLRDGKGLRRGE